MKSHQKSLLGGLIALGVAAAGIVALAGPPDDLQACGAPSFHDGDALRCAGQRRSMRLYAIDAPEMPGACRAGRVCTPGDPFASRDHLAGLARGKDVRWRQVDTDHYGRFVVQAFADGEDLSCAQVRDGFAVERYGKLKC
jgi:endonuclease YncB( thermonuclease family)